MELVYYPHIEHGINFSHDTIDFQLAKKIPAFIFQGKYKKYMVQEVSKRTPVFCIGPYIQYAQDYYESDKISKLRSLNGSTVTMFPTHTYEKSHSRYHREDFVNTTMSKYKERFHTIQVCVYWNDIDDPIYRMFQEKGAKLVSAGMRFDYKFLSRLKTIIELSDCIAGNDIGTYLGYALSLGKKISFIDSEIEEYDQNVISNMSLISKEKKRRIANSILLKDENIMLNELDPYWGLSIPQYSPDEMKMMLYFVKAIVQNSHGKTDRFKISTQNVFNEWINGSRGQIEFIRSRLGFDLNS
jgi:hypothetical protein